MEFKPETGSRWGPDRRRLRREQEQKERQRRERRSAGGPPAHGRGARAGAPSAPAVQDPSAAVEQISASASAVREVSAEEHRLSDTWTFHYYTPGISSGKLQKDTWQSQVQILRTVASVEQFWGVWEALLPPTQIKVGTDYHLFKQHINPSWEDPKNANGGMWVLEFRQQQDRGAVDFDEVWSSLVLALIGNTFTDGGMITGVTCGVRNNRQRLRIWTREAEDEALQMRIATQIKEFTQLPNGTRLHFEAHNDAMNTASRVKAKYELF